jgi:hypothetical protein
MSSNIKLRRSAIPGKIPTVEQLDLGEFAVNTFDGKLYTKKNVNGTESIVSFAGVTGSESSVIVNSFTGDGTTTNFTLSRIPTDEDHVFVTINGVSQHVDVYSVTGNILTFSEAPVSGDEIETRIIVINATAISLRDYETYIFSANNDTTFTGADINDKILEYEVGKLEVYINGVRLVNTLDYSAIDGSSVITSSPLTGTVEIISLSRATFADNSQIKAIKTDLTTTANNQIADTFDSNTYRTAKYLIQVTANTDYHATELLLIHDGTNAYTTEYGTIFTNESLATFSADISSGAVRLLVSPVDINSAIRIQRIAVTAL